MKLAAVLCFVSLGLAVAPSLAAEGEQAPDKPDRFAKICDAYGPGYNIVPGTDICVKISGYVKMNVYYGRGGKLPPAAYDDPTGITTKGSGDR